MPRPVTPTLAADTIIELIDYPGRPIVLTVGSDWLPQWTHYSCRPNGVPAA